MKLSMHWALRHLSSQRRGELSCSFTQDLTQFYSFYCKSRLSPIFKRFCHSSTLESKSVNSYFKHSMFSWSPITFLLSRHLVTIVTDSIFILRCRKQYGFPNLYFFCEENHRPTVLKPVFISIERLLYGQYHTLPIK